MSPRNKDETTAKKSSPLKMKEEILGNLRDVKDKMKMSMKSSQEESKRYLDEHIINCHIEKHEEKSKTREEENKGAFTKTNERKASTSEKKIEEKENIPRPRSRNIEKVRRRVKYLKEYELCISNYSCCGFYVHKTPLLM